MHRDPDCIFCQIVSVHVPAAVVYESASILAFLDVAPLADGHLLIIPRDHFDTLAEMPPTEASQLANAIPLLGRSLLEVTKAEGFNVLINNGSAAGQVVRHAHVHMIPRRTGDQLGFRWNAGTYPEGRAEELATAYQGALRRLIG